MYVNALQSLTFLRFFQRPLMALLLAMIVAEGDDDDDDAGVSNYVFTAHDT